MRWRRVKDLEGEWGEDSFRRLVIRKRRSGDWSEMKRDRKSATELKDCAIDSGSRSDLIVLKKPCARCTFVNSNITFFSSRSA